MTNVKNCNGGGGTLSSTPISSGIDKPSRGTSEARGEQESAKTLSFRCDCERCCLTRGADKPSEISSLAPEWESGFAYGRSEASPDSEQIEHVIAEQFMRNSVSVEQIQDRCVRRTGEGSHSDKIAQQVRDDSANSLAPRGRGLGRGGKAAFTLAEVLITLGIIGVVAAMTLPSLIQNYQKKALATQTQKFYSTMSQAVKQYMADYGVDDLRNTPLASDNYEEGYSPEAMASLRDFATKYLKVVKECKSRDEGGDNCFAPEYRYWNNSLIGNSYINGWPNTYVLADGSTISISYCGNKEAPCQIDLYVDVNGKKGPNKPGYDWWDMDIFYDGVIDEGTVTPECRKEGDCINYGDTPSEIRETKYKQYCIGDSGYGACFGHFLDNGFKFDY